MDAHEKRSWLGRFEHMAHRLITGSKDPKLMYGKDGAVTKFFAEHPAAKDGLWVNGHMHLKQGYSPDQAAAIWYTEVARALLPRPILNQQEEDPHGETREVRRHQPV